MTPSKFLLPLAAFAVSFASARAAADYRLDQTLHLGGSGAWDYVSIDSAHHLLFVPRSTHTQVVDLSNGTVIADLTGQHHNHGCAIAPNAGRGFISDGKDACVYIFDLKTYQVLGKVKVDDDADGIQYDAGTNKVLVVCGDPGHLYAFAPDIDPVNGSPGEPADLGGSVEFFAFDGLGKAYVNLNDKNQVGVVDLSTMKVLAKWGIGSGGKPVGMSIDRQNGRLFVGCRDPQKLVILDTDGGKLLGELPIGAGVDATAFDNGCAFASCRDGTLTVAGPAADGTWSVLQTVATRPGARTMCVDPATHTIYLPTAELGKGKKAPPKAGTFMILEVKPAAG